MTNPIFNELDPFYPIVAGTDELRLLLVAGIRLVQLRIKDGSKAHRLAEIRLARELCETSRCRLVVNDHWREAIDTGCEFVHLGQDDLADADLGALRASGVRFGVSTHDDAELGIALATAPAYIAFGPIFPTASKILDWPSQGLTRLRDWRTAVGAIPLVAIGGITLDRVAEVLDAGADSVAVIGDVARHADPTARAATWLSATRRFIR